MIISSTKKKKKAYCAIDRYYEPPFALYQYKKRVICLRCRKAFKATDRKNCAPVKCPDCAEETIDVHFDFRPPRKNDKKSWAKIQRILERNKGQWPICGHGKKDPEVD